MLRYDRQTKLGLVALYDIRPGKRSGSINSYNPGARTGRKYLEGPEYVLTPKCHILSFRTVVGLCKFYIMKDESCLKN